MKEVILKIILCYATNLVESKIKEHSKLERKAEIHIGKKAEELSNLRQDYNKKLLKSNEEYEAMCNFLRGINNGDSIEEPLS